MNSNDALEEWRQKLFGVTREKVDFLHEALIRYTRQEADVYGVEAAFDDYLRGEKVVKRTVDELADEYVVSCRFRFSFALQ